MIEKLKTWVKQSILEMGAEYPDTVGKIACMIIDRELADKTFLPGDMPARYRADFAFPIINGMITNRIYEIKKLIAQIIILNHRINHHAKALTEKGALVVEREKCYQTLNKYGYTFTDLERELMAESAGVWSFETDTGDGDGEATVKKAM